MSSEALKQDIRETARQNAEKVLAKANAEAARILAEAQTQARAITDGRVQDSQKLLDQVERAEVAKARIECARSLSAAEARQVEAAFLEAEKRVCSLPSTEPDRYRRALTRFIEEARVELGGSRLVVVARDEERELVGSILKGLGEVAAKLSVSQDSLDARGGVILHTEDMRVYYVNTLDSRFRRAREELRSKVVHAMLKGAR